MDIIINPWKRLIFALLTFTAFIMLCFFISFFNAKYSIWKARQHGLSQLAEAEGNRLIAICEAKASQEAAECFAQAEIIRAKGVAEANKIIGDSLQGNEAYLRYLWIQGLQTNQMQTVYIPTEAGLPILEAGKR